MWAFIIIHRREKTHICDRDKNDNRGYFLGMRLSPEIKKKSIWLKLGIRCFPITGLTRIISIPYLLPQGITISSMTPAYQAYFQSLETTANLGWLTENL